MLFFVHTLSSVSSTTVRYQPAHLILILIWSYHYIPISSIFFGKGRTAVVCIYFLSHLTCISNNSWGHFANFPAKYCIYQCVISCLGGYHHLPVISGWHKTFSLYLAILCGWIYITYNELCTTSETRVTLCLCNDQPSMFLCCFTVLSACQNIYRT